MRFTKEIIISQPLGRVLELLDDPEHIKQWQPDLLSITPLSGTPGRPGAKSTLAYDVNGRKVNLIETIVARNLPEESTATYETNGMVHTISNRLSAVDDKATKMVSDNQIQFSGLMKVMGSFIAGHLREQSERNMDSFKSFAEKAGSCDHPR